MKLHQRLAWIRKLPAPATVKAVLWVLADHSDSQGHCWLLQSTLAREAGLTDRSVRTVLHRLKSKAVLTVRHTGKYDHYYLNLALFRLELDSGLTGTTFLQNRPKNPAPRRKPKRASIPIAPCGRKHWPWVDCFACRRLGYSPEKPPLDTQASPA